MTKNDPKSTVSELCIYVYIYFYVCMCVCVYVCMQKPEIREAYEIALAVLLGDI